MFEPAAAPGAEQQDEGVVVVRNLAHHVGLGGDDLLHVAPHALRVVVALAVYDDAVRHAFDLELDDAEIADQERRVVEDVEVLGAEGVARARDGGQARGDLPAGRRLDAQRQGRAQVSFGVHERRRVVPEGVAVVHFVRAHAQLVRVDVVADYQLARTIRLYPPRVLVSLVPRERAPAGVRGLEVLDVAPELAHEVGAGSPDGHAQVNSVRRSRRVAQALNYIEQVRVRLPYRDGVADLRGVGRDGAAALVRLRARRMRREGEKDEKRREGQ